MYYLWMNDAQVGPFSLEQLRAFVKEGSINAKTLFWQEGMTEWTALETIQGLFSEPTSAMRISGFWVRIGAWVLDALILGIPALFVGFFLFDFFARLGAAGHLLGLGIGLCYFGLLNSSLGKGQTLGERLVGIEVVDREGRHLSPARSLLRYAILATPFYLSGIPALAGLSLTSWGYIVISDIVFAFGWMIFYLYVFNSRTRQSLHDLVAGSYVVKTSRPGVVEALPVWRGHFVIAGLSLCALLAVSTVGMALTLRSTILGVSFPDLLVLQQALADSGEVNSASVNEGTSWSSFNGDVQKTKVLSVVVSCKTRPDDYDIAAQKMAAIVLSRYSQVAKDDRLGITVVYGYNIGIAAWSTSRVISHTPQEWKQLLASRPSA